MTKHKRKLNGRNFNAIYGGPYRTGPLVQINGWFVFEKEYRDPESQK